MSLPVRGAWVEIFRADDTYNIPTSLPVRGAWVEMPLAFGGVTRCLSLPVRGAWVEINLKMHRRQKWVVAPRAGSVG